MNEKSFEEVMESLFDSVSRALTANSKNRECPYAMDEIVSNFEMLSGEDDIQIERVKTFVDRGVLTMNKGLVVTLSTGDEFQLTIVQSKYGTRHCEETNEDEE